ncbi:MAG: hypothetical protein MZV63_69205 [Marinilabiliales bacterium]|nr:hypothetical protein [Marinilabiliales bacterium]
MLEFVHEYADLPWREQQIISLDSSRLLIPTKAGVQHLRPGKARRF